MVLFAGAKISPEVIEQIRVLVDKGISVSTIERRIEVSKSTIRAVKRLWEAVQEARSLGRPKDEKYLISWVLYDSGVSYSAISEIVGISYMPELSAEWRKMVGYEYAITEEERQRFLSLKPKPKARNSRGDRKKDDIANAEKRKEDWKKAVERIQAKVIPEYTASRIRELQESIRSRGELTAELVKVNDRIRSLNEMEKKLKGLVEASWQPKTRYSKSIPTVLWFGFTGKWQKAQTSRPSGLSSCLRTYHLHHRRFVPRQRPRKDQHRSSPVRWLSPARPRKTWINERERSGPKQNPPLFRSKTLLSRLKSSPKKNRLSQPSSRWQPWPSLPFP